MSYYDSAPSATTYGNKAAAQSRPAREPRPAVDTSNMSPEELFDYRKGFKLNFGKYKGLSLNEIAAVEENGLQVGLTYLHWLSNLDAEETWPPLLAALTTFMAHPQVEADVKEAVAVAASARPKGRY